MSRDDKNIFYNTVLNFRITKPGDWAFMPVQWSENFSATLEFEDEELQKAYTQAQQPFVSFYKPHSNPNHIYPTVKCSARKNYGLHIEDEMQGLMDRFSSMLGGRIIESSTDYILSGKRCLYTKMRLELEDDKGNIIPCLGRIFIIPTKDYIFMVGLTGGVQEPYCCEETFLEILQSVSL